MRRLLTGGAESVDLHTGRGERFQIDSVAQLPLDRRETLLALDHRHAQATKEEEGRLTPTELEMFRFLGEFYPAHPLISPP